MMSEARDEALAQRAATGEREAFVILYNRYVTKVYNRVKTRVPLVDADDVVQDIFIAVVRSLPNFESRSQFNTWLYTIVNRQIADFYRKHYRDIKREKVSMTLEDADRTGLAVAPTDEQDEVENRAVLQRALARIPQHYQDVITMRIADKLTFDEIAKSTGRTIESVKSLYRRALQAIRTEIGDIDL